MADPPVSLAICPDDSERRFRIRLEADRQSAAQADGPADCKLAGSSSALYLFLWNRGGAGLDIEVSGDRSVLDTWREKARVVWA